MKLLTQSPKKALKAFLKQKPQSHTKEFEFQLDQLVYKLYDITPEEQKIIEGN
jgi:hypothetical protein